MMQYRNKSLSYGKHEASNKVSFLEFEKYLDDNYEGVSFYKDIYPKI